MRMVQPKRRDFNLESLDGANAFADANVEYIQYLERELNRAIDRWNTSTI